MKKQSITIIVIILFLPIKIWAQSDGSIPTETPIPLETPVSIVSTPVPAVSAPRVTALPTPSPSVSFSPSPIPTSLSNILNLPVNTVNQGSNNLVLSIVALGTISLAAFGYVIFKGKTKKNNNDDDRCGNIRELLEQKKKELEEFVRSWPEEKIKGLAKEKALGELKKNEDAKKIIETSERLKAKHDKLRETIELLQKRYDLCILELPSLGKPKNLKFKSFKAELILDGSKTATIRLFDDKDLKSGDDLELINSDDGKFFAKAKITEVVQKRLGEVDIIDLDGHEKWNNREEMLESFKKYYGDNINLDTMAKIVRFKIIK